MLCEEILGPPVCQFGCGRVEMLAALTGEGVVLSGIDIRRDQGVCLEDRQDLGLCFRRHEPVLCRDMRDIGLGYVGLPLAAAFAKKRNVVGFDINHERINELKQHVDITREIESKTLKKLNRLIFS